eukprot:TRINITY_DN3529_c0_g1_i4.p4 TRINITY_DN3529_c0_g1~~TRINITY_DN3529_c0_g1_i4.p4  ORF type:complete len:175 (-),score=19.20 TRINITY_DN3529_c0_g1_i4:567-1091(-)
MSWLFGKKKTPAEILRENKRMLDKAIRELDRERVGLQNQEKKLVSEIKTAARQGQMGAVQVMAKSLVRNRHAVTKMYGLKSQLQAVSLRMATLKSTQAMADSMQGATKAMKAMNKKLNLPALQQIMRQFEQWPDFGCEGIKVQRATLHPLNNYIFLFAKFLRTSHALYCRVFVK